MSNATPAPTGSSGGGRRFMLVLAYDGTGYHGWARQPGLPTIEATLADALARAARVDRVALTCAGRTDAGVHAAGQVVHADLPDATDPARLHRSLNGLLPADIRCRSITAAPAGFDARFAALWRRYRYTVTDGVPDPLTRHMVLAARQRLDVAAMSEAVHQLTGVHDFGSFCKPRDGATTVREVLECAWTREADGRAVLEVRADAFCHSMVRSIVGASLMVGSGRREPAWFGQLIAEPSRSQAAPVAPAHGLVLQEIGYPAAELMAERVRAARQVRSPIA